MESIEHIGSEEHLNDACAGMAKSAGTVRIVWMMRTLQSI